MITTNKILEKSYETEVLTKESIGITPPEEINKKTSQFESLQQNILSHVKNLSKYKAISNTVNNNTLSMSSGDNDYIISPVKGPTYPIYPIAPSELLEPKSEELLASSEELPDASPPPQTPPPSQKNRKQRTIERTWERRLDVARLLSSDYDKFKSKIKKLFRNKEDADEVIKRKEQELFEKS